MTATGFDVYREADGDVLTLRKQPRLESWDARGSRSQTLLREYLDDLVDLADATLVGLEGRLAIALHVGLPGIASTRTAGDDLDNYLFPVVRRLGPDRFVSARASKTPGGTSTVRISVAQPADARELEGWAFASVETTASTTTARWKQQITDAVAASVTSAPQGGLELHVACAVASSRNWAALWKPAIDALGPILGVDNPAAPFAPRDDRIVRLALHRTIDDSLGHRVRLAVWWREIVR